LSFDRGHHSSNCGQLNPRTRSHPAVSRVSWLWPRCHAAKSALAPLAIRFHNVADPGRTQRQ
jgi:hypothetical protein